MAKSIHTKLYNRLIILTLMVSILGFGLINLPWQTSKEILLAEAKELQDIESNPFKNLEITGSAAIVFDVKNKKVVFAKDTETQLPLASITKVMTALVATNYDPDLTITVSGHDLKEGSNAGLNPSRWKLKNLIDFSLVTSSNGASKAIASQLTINSGQDFIKQMNEQANKLGLKQTYFINPTGLDVGGPYGGSYGSALDIAKLFSYILENKPELLLATTESSINTRSLDNQTYTGYNTNQVVNQIPGILGSKTGFTDNAGGNLAIAFDAGLNEPYVVVVLGSTRENRFNDVLKLMQSTIKYHSNL